MNRQPWMHVGVFVFQVMGTPKRAALSLTAVLPVMRKKASSMMAIIWLYLRWGQMLKIQYGRKVNPDDQTAFTVFNVCVSHRRRWTPFQWCPLCSAVWPTTPTCQQAAKSMKRPKITRRVHDRLKSLSRLDSCVWSVHLRPAGISTRRVALKRLVCRPSARAALNNKQQSSQCMSARQEMNRAL